MVAVLFTGDCAFALVTVLSTSDGTFWWLSFTMLALLCDGDCFSVVTVLWWLQWWLYRAVVTDLLWWLYFALVTILSTGDCTLWWLYCVGCTVWWWLFSVVTVLCSAGCALVTALQQWLYCAMVTDLPWWLYFAAVTILWQLWGADVAQWLERQTCDQKVVGSNPCWSSGRNFF